MNSHKRHIAIAVLVVGAAISFPAAFAQGFFQEEACPDCDGTDIYQKEQRATHSDVPISIWTDAPAYNHDTEIRIEGQVANLRPNDAPVTITVLSPLNNIVAVKQIPVGSDRMFGTTISTAGELWKYDGFYEIQVQYGNSAVNDSVKVQLMEGVISPATCQENELSTSGQCIPFSITGGAVTSSRINPATTSMIITLNAENDGVISLDIPRAVLDSQVGETDAKFVVLIDGEEVDYEESLVNQWTRSVNIPFSSGAQQIEIIGTFAIPEFGTIAAIILAVAIISIIAVTARTRLTVMPKY